LRQDSKYPGIILTSQAITTGNESFSMHGVSSEVHSVPSPTVLLWKRVGEGESTGVSSWICYPKLAYLPVVQNLFHNRGLLPIPPPAFSPKGAQPCQGGSGESLSILCVTWFEGGMWESKYNVALPMCIQIHLLYAESFGPFASPNNEALASIRFLWSPVLLFVSPA